ncbi:MAG TPA: cupredoxin domain-containing protein, partial [Candidatus Nitrosotenuis sp.]|nr:cupredoxin domain-containing protein [Candidatus Nitrosotenuis sp.]
GAMPAFGFHIHGTIFDAFPSGVLENEPVKAQTWEVSPGNAAIFEARWTEPGRYLFHLHGIPEERGTMAYFNVTDAPSSAVDGIDIAKTKPVYMWEWEKSQIVSLEKADSDSKIAKTSAGVSGHLMHDLLGDADRESKTVETTSCEIENGATMQTANKSFHPGTIRVNAGDTVRWDNKDTGVHTVTSKDGTFDSGMIMKGGSFENKFVQKGTFDYFCALHPWMKGSVQVV